jgi:hypothetical protein
VVGQVTGAAAVDVTKMALSRTPELVIFALVTQSRSSANFVPGSSPLRQLTVDHMEESGERHGPLRAVYPLPLIFQQSTYARYCPVPESQRAVYVLPFK